MIRLQRNGRYVVTCDYGQRRDAPGTCRVEVSVSGHTELFGVGWRTTAGNWGPVPGLGLPGFSVDDLASIVTWCPKHVGDRRRRTDHG